jgi:hypothetical protein
MEIYSEERIAEFDEQNNSAIAGILKKQPA